MKLIVEKDYLAHHGVLGMKWGVRRYQNYDGSYTQKGMKRYNKAQSDYDSAKEERNKSRMDYKSGKISKAEYKSSKMNLRTSKKELDKAYNNLKNDKMADEGKKLYQKGKTITDNRQNLYISETAIVLGSGFVNKFLSESGNQKIATIATSAIATGGTFVNAMLAMKVSSENKKLRAYYAH